MMEGLQEALDHPTTKATKYPKWLRICWVCHVRYWTSHYATLYCSKGCARLADHHGTVTREMIRERQRQTA